MPRGVYRLASSEHRRQVHARANLEQINVRRPGRGVPGRSRGTGVAEEVTLVLRREVKRVERALRAAYKAGDKTEARALRRELSTLSGRLLAFLSEGLATPASRVRAGAGSDEETTEAVVDRWLRSGA